MSKLFRTTGVIWLLAAFIIAGTPTKQALAQPGAQVSFQMFYNTLQPHGQWFNYGNYGYCWAPNVGTDFRPYYSNGYWAMTNYGNTWVSNYSWGWAPFHYGSWIFDDYYGWIWVPGNTWAPAHVSWRTGGGVYGWAPLAPGVSINVAISPTFNCGYDRWIFVPQQHIYNRGFQRYWRGIQYNRTVINNTTIINNTYINNNNRYVFGPRANEVQRATGQRVRTYGVRTGVQPGRTRVQGNELNIYRPTVQKRGNERPQRVATTAQVRQSAPTRNRATTQRGTTNNGTARTQRATAPVTGNQRATTAPARTQRATAPATRNQRAATAPAHTQRPAATRNTAPARSRATTPARQPQQQQRITERRQQSWQQQRSPSRSNPSVNRSRSTQPARSNPAVNRSQTTQRNTRTVRPQTQTRPQRSVAPSRSSAPQRSAAPARSRSTQRSAAPARSNSRSTPNRSNNSSSSKWR